MKKKFLSSLITISITMSMGYPVFAADQTVQGTSSQSGTIPVTGSIEKYIPESQIENGKEINVSIPTSMAFDIGYDKYTQKSNLKSADYTITNNGNNAVSVTSQYDLINAGGVVLTTPDKVNPTDSNLELALSLNAEKAANPTTPWIQSVTDKAIGNAINIDSKATEHMQFATTEQGLANINQHAKDGKLSSKVDIKGNLVLTFNVVENKNIASSFRASVAGNSVFSNVTLNNGKLIIDSTKIGDVNYFAIVSYSVNDKNSTRICNPGEPVKINQYEINNLKTGDIIQFNGANPHYFGSIELSNGVGYTFNNVSKNLQSFKIKILSPNTFELITTDMFVQK